jgi:hypothetical protein
VPHQRAAPQIATPSSATRFHTAKARTGPQRLKIAALQKLTTIPVSRRWQIPAVLSFAALEGLDISIVRDTANA